MSVIECPGCGRSQELGDTRRTADQFCPQCDYPLFFVPGPAETNGDLDVDEPAGLDPSLRRRPGLDGLAGDQGLACPACGEPNHDAAQFCSRCGASLHPEPEPTGAVEVVEAEPVAPAPVAVPPAEQHDPLSRWLIPLLVVVVLLVLFGLVIALVL